MDEESTKVQVISTYRGKCLARRLIFVDFVLDKLMTADIIEKVDHSE